MDNFKTQPVPPENPTALTPYLNATRLNRIIDHKLGLRVGTHAKGGAAYALDDLLETLTPSQNDMLTLLMNPASASDLFESRLWNTLLVIADLAREKDAQLLLITEARTGGERYRSTMDKHRKGDGYSFAKAHSLQHQQSKIVAVLPFPPTLTEPTAVISWVMDTIAWVKRQIDTASL
jgi:hypothetical protein